MTRARLWLLVAVGVCLCLTASGHEQRSHNRRSSFEEPGHQRGAETRRRGDDQWDSREGRYVDMEEIEGGRGSHGDYVRVVEPYYDDGDYDGGDYDSEVPEYVVEPRRPWRRRRVEVIDEPRRRSKIRHRVLYVPRHREVRFSDLEEAQRERKGGGASDQKKVETPLSDDDTSAPSSAEAATTPKDEPPQSAGKESGGSDTGLDSDVPSVPKEILEAPSTSAAETDEASFLNGHAGRQAATAWGKGIDIRIDDSDKPAISRMGGAAEKDEFAPVMCSDGGRSNVKMTVGYAGNVVAEGSDAKSTGSNTADNILVVSSDSLKLADEVTWNVISAASEPFGFESVPDEAVILSLDTKTGRNDAGVFQPTNVKYTEGHQAFFHAADGVNTGWVSMKTNNLDSGAYFIIFCHRGLAMYRCVGGAKFTVERCAEASGAKTSLELLQMDMDTWKVLENDHVSPEDMKVMRQIDEQFSGAADSDLGEDSLAPNLSEEVNADVSAVEDEGRPGKKARARAPGGVDLAESSSIDGDDGDVSDDAKATEDMPILHVSNKGVLCQTGGGNKCGEHVNVIMFNPQVWTNHKLVNRLMLIDPKKIKDPTVASSFITIMNEEPLDYVNLPSTDAFTDISLDKESFVAAISLNVASDNEAFSNAAGDGYQWGAVTECLGPNYCLMNVPHKLIESLPSDHRLYLMLGYTESDDYASTSLVSREAVAHLSSPDQPLPADAVVKAAGDEESTAKGDGSETNTGDASAPKGAGGGSVNTADTDPAKDGAAALIRDNESLGHPVVEKDGHGGHVSVQAERLDDLAVVEAGGHVSVKAERLGDLSHGEDGTGDGSITVDAEKSQDSGSVSISAKRRDDVVEEEVHGHVSVHAERSQDSGSVSVSTKRRDDVVEEEVSDVPITPLVEEAEPAPKETAALIKVEENQEAKIEKVEKVSDPPKPKIPEYNVKASRGLAGSMQQEPRSTLTRGARDRAERKEAEALQSTFAVVAKDTGDDMLSVMKDTDEVDGATASGVVNPKGDNKAEVASERDSEPHATVSPHEETPHAEEGVQKKGGNGAGSCKSEVEGDLNKYEGCMDTIHSVCKIFSGEAKDQFVKQGDECVKVGCTFKDGKSFLFVQKVDVACASHSELPVCTDAMKASTEKTVQEGCQFIDKVSSEKGTSEAVGFKDLWGSLLCNVRHSGKESAGYVGHYSACFKKYDSGNILIGTDQPPSGSKLLKGLEVET